MTDRHRDENGFALPAAILAMVVVGILITGGIQLATQESRIGQAGERATRAFYVAESAMHTVLANFNPAQAGLDVWEMAVRTGTVPGGEWDARIRRIEEELFWVETEGRVTAGQGVSAARQLGVVARVYTIPLEPPAALQTMGEVNVSGSAEIHGEDSHPATWDGELCPDPLENLPGVVTDTDGSLNAGPNTSVTGDPDPHVTDPDLTTEDFRQFGDTSWEELTSLADLVLPAGNLDNPAPSLTVNDLCNYQDLYNWGDPLLPSGPCGSYFPTIHVQGNATIEGGYGQGILLVDGDLRLSGNFEFYGIIVAQGDFTVTGGGANAPRISGGVMASGAALEVEEDDGDHSIVGSSIVQNSRCAVTRALQNNTGMHRLRMLDERSWVDLTGARF